MTRPWETLASVPTPEGALVLLRRADDDFLITINGRVLMSSTAHRSEDDLAKLGCAGLRSVPGARVLVSGLGMGFTLRAALDELAADAVVTVAELNPVVVDWCGGPLGAMTKHAAKDPRVTVEVVDVAACIARVARDPSRGRFHAIVLDMYEGPQTTPRANDPLYGVTATQRVKQGLAPGGTYAVWCEGASPGFERTLRNAGFEFRLHRGGRGARIHWVYVARSKAKL